MPLRKGHIRGEITLSGELNTWLLEKAASHGLKTKGVIILAACHKLGYTPNDYEKRKLQIHGYIK